MELAAVVAERPADDDARLALLRQAAIRAVIRPSTTSPRPGPPTAYAPGQSIAAQTISGATSVAVHGAACRTLPAHRSGVDAQAVAGRAART